MSRAVARDRRIPGDAYYTPPALAEHLVGLLGPWGGRVVLEPSAGGGAFVRALLAAGTEVVFTNDINPDAPGQALVAPTHRRTKDFLDLARIDVWCGGPPDWIVGNPPFRVWREHVEHALTIAPRVAFLLRLAALESRARYDFWQRTPARRVWVLSERPSFTGGGNDNAAYGFFVWERGWAGTTELSVASWRA
mgnify:FL=1